MTTMAAPSRCRWRWGRGLGSEPEAAGHQRGGGLRASLTLYTTPVIYLFLDRFSRHRRRPGRLLRRRSRRPRPGSGRRLPSFLGNALGAASSRRRR